MRRRFISRWQGIVLALVGIVATVWLAVTDRLALYIHPRYIGFTIVMAVIAAGVVVAAFVFAPVAGDDDEHDDDSARDEAREDAYGNGDGAASARRGRLLAGTGTAATLAIVVGSIIALLVLPPATLTAATASQRSVNSSTDSLTDAGTSLVGADRSSFTVKDWALLLRQDPDPAAYPDVVEMTGFVSPSPDDPDDVFYLARFTVTCCAVDAQPVGVAVHLPGWNDQFDEGQWLEISGRFGAVAGVGIADPLLLVPESVEPIDEPAQPYVF